MKHTTHRQSMRVQYFAVTLLLTVGLCLLSGPQRLSKVLSRRSCRKI